MIARQSPHDRMETRDAEVCHAPRDAQYFDESSVRAVPPIGTSLELARFELQPRYCGLLEYFAQFTNRFAVDPSQIETPGLEWSLVVNGRPLHPYLAFDRVVNPWGFGSFPLRIPLEERSTVSLVVRATETQPAGAEVARVGGRLLGRYWYDVTYGGASRSRA
jgi:hypothetical protein